MTNLTTTVKLDAINSSPSLVGIGTKVIIRQGPTLIETQTGQSNLILLGDFTKGLSSTITSIQFTIPGPQTYVLDGFSITFTEYLSAVGSDPDGVENRFLFTQADNLTGSNFDDKLYGFEGNDTIIGGLGNDTINGGTQNDTLFGGLGDDSLEGGTGNDTAIYGDVGVTVDLGKSGAQSTGEGLDTLSGIENLRSGQGSDELTGDTAANKLAGGGGKDRLFGMDGADSLNGGAGNDKLFGNKGDDKLGGGSGNDVLKGGTGNDRMFGNIGEDTLIGSAGKDLLKGGDGNDQLRGDNGDDKLIGDKGNDILVGGKGNDKLNGGDGRDVLDGGKGDDKLTGGAFADTFIFGPGDDVVTDFDSENGLEKINVQGVASIVNLKDLLKNHIKEIDDSVVIDDLNGNTLTLLNVSIDGLGSNDFIF